VGGKTESVTAGQAMNNNTIHRSERTNTMKYSLYFATHEECVKAEYWLRANFDCIEEYDVSFNGTVLFFYTTDALTERQKEIIKTTLTPLSFLSDED
jgi:hypothetical protein